MYVIDASVYVSRLQPTEIHHLASKRLLERLQAQRLPVACPTLLWPEVAAALVRGTQNTALARMAVRHLRRLPHHHYVPLDQSLARLAADLAAERHLRGADAVYVALAQRLGYTLLTWDAEQHSRAAPIVPTLTPNELEA